MSTLIIRIWEEQYIIVTLHYHLLMDKTISAAVSINY
jgi:hypothetical protein